VTYRISGTKVLSDVPYFCNYSAQWCSVFLLLYCSVAYRISVTIVPSDVPYFWNQGSVTYRISGTRVQWRTVFLEPGLSDEAAVADDGDAGQLQVFFTISHQLSDVRPTLNYERLAAREIHLLHPCSKRTKILINVLSFVKYFNALLDHFLIDLPYMHYTAASLWFFYALNAKFSQIFWLASPGVIFNKVVIDIWQNMMTKMTFTSTVKTYNAHHLPCWQFSRPPQCQILDPPLTWFIYQLHITHPWLSITHVGHFTDIFGNVW